jgi:hypothetical protein
VELVLTGISVEFNGSSQVKTAREIRRQHVCSRGTEGVEGEMKSVLYSCVEDEGRPLGIGFQEQVSNQPELLR